MRIFDIVTDRGTDTDTDIDKHTHTQRERERERYIGNDPGDRKLWVAAPEFGGKKSQKSSISGFV